MPYFFLKTVLVKNFTELLVSIESSEMNLLKEEKQKIMNELSNIQESERQLKRECKI
jgi:hypothetical protein